MTTSEIQTTLQRAIRTTVFVTVDRQGLPQACAIDLMLADESGLFPANAVVKE